MKKYNIIVLLVLLFSCSKENEEKNNGNKQTITENNVTKITLDKKEYITARNSKIIIEPIIERETEQSDKDLQFTWTIESEIISLQRNLDYTIPRNQELGTKKCSYKVTNKSTNKEQNVEFILTTVNPYGYGYYFLSEDENKHTQLFHINTTKNSDVVFNTSVIEDVTIGDTPQILSKKKIYNPTTNNYYELSIVTNKGEYPYIKTNTNTFTLDDKIEKNGYSINFTPSFHMLNTRGIDFFINNGEILIYSNNCIYSSDNNGNYDWKNPIQGLIGKHIYMFDKISNKYYQIIPDDNGYTYNNIMPIATCPIMRDEELAGYHRTLARTTDGSIKEEVSLLTATMGKLNRYKIENTNNNVLIKHTKADFKDGITQKTSITTAEDGTFYLGIGNKIEISSSIHDELKLFTTLPTGGDIVKLVISDDNLKLIVSTYDKKSNLLQKGSIYIIEIKSKKIISYPNTITKCVSIADCSNSIL